MNILFTYIRKYLLNNKISTFYSILSLLTASSLFYIVVCLGTNTIIGMNDSIIRSFGNYHAVYRNVDDTFIDSLNLHDKTTQVNIVEYKKQLYVESLQSKEKDSLYILGIDHQSFNRLGLSLIEGNFPNNNHEIIVSNHLIDDSKIRFSIGQMVKLDDEAYKVVGTFSNSFFDMNESFYSILTKNDDIGRKDAYVLFKNNSYSSIDQIAHDFIGKYDSFEKNEHYLYESFHKIDHLVLFFVIVIFCLAFVFFGMNVLLIRNCYKNSYLNREKHLAILKTVGVTQSQCNTMILYEGILLLVISLIIGLMSGWIIYEILRNVLNGLLQSISVYSFTIGNKYCVLISIITILYVVSFALYFIRKSTKKIIHQSVSSTLQSNDEVEVMDHPYLELEKKQSIFMRLLKKNIRQNKKSYQHLYIGMTSIVALFILVNGFMGYFREGIFFETNDHNYDVEVVVKLDYYPTNLMTQFKNVEYASGVVISEKLRLECSDFSILNNEYQDLNILKDSIEFEVMTYSDKIIKDFLSYSDYNHLIQSSSPTGIFINETYSSSHRRFYDILSDNLIKELRYKDDVVLKNIHLIETNYLITGTNYQKNPQIIVTHELFDEMFEKLYLKQHEYHVYFQSNDAISLVRELNTLNDNDFIDFDVINTTATIRNNKVMITLVRILLYGYILLLGIMSILSTSCIASVNFDYRKREFLMYRVLGLRMIDMMKLIFVELCYYISKIFIYAWIISQSLNYLFYEIYFKNLGLQFFIPENSIIGSIVIIFAMLVISMSYIYLRMKSLKNSIILKNEIRLM